MRPDASQKLAAAGPKKSGPSKALIAAIVAIVVALAAVLAWWQLSKDDNSSSSTAKSSVSATPKGALADGKGFPVYADKAKGNVNTVEIYEDFQCPFCKQLEDAAGAKTEKLAADGKIKLTYHVLSFLDANLQNDASAKSANAAFCAADQGQFLKFHNSVFANQPTKEGQGYTEQQYLQWGKDAGISGGAYEAFTKCVKSNSHGDYVKKTNDRMGPDNVTGTPTVKVNGKAISDSDMQALMTGADPTGILTK